MNHASTHVTLPTAGIVAVVGPNGAGKSALIEAVSYAVWGKTLRGVDPWPDSSQDGLVLAEVNDLIVARHRHGASVKLVWQRVGEQPVEWGTNTKAQAALERLVGPWDVWRRANVFSASDAALFTVGTDGTRKRLLEELLGLDRFDDALEACRRDLREIDRQVSSANTTRILAGERASAERARLDLLTAQLAEVAREADVDRGKDLEAEISYLRGLVFKTDRDIEQTARERNSRQHSVVEFATELRTATAQHQAINRAHCPTCSQAIPIDLVMTSRARLEGLLEKNETARASHESQERALHLALIDLQGERDSFIRKCAELERQQAMTKAAKTRLERARIDFDGARKACTEQRSYVEKANEIIAQLSGEQVTLRAVESVLGLKGVRAHLLERALAALEALAGQWLQRLSSAPVKLRLSSETLRASGKVASDISIVVEGQLGAFGGGHGYKGSSNGERRRLDVALLLGLGALASAAYNQPDATLFVDEVFDSLDDAGVERLADALESIAMERGIVIVTHRHHLVSSLRNAARLRIESGALKELS